MNNNSKKPRRFCESENALELTRQNPVWRGRSPDVIHPAATFRRFHEIPEINRSCVEKRAARGIEYENNGLEL